MKGGRVGGGLVHLFVSSHGHLIVQVVEKSLAVCDAKGEVDVLVRVGEVVVPGWVQALLLHHIDLFTHRSHHVFHGHSLSCTKNKVPTDYTQPTAPS